MTNQRAPKPVQPNQAQAAALRLRLERGVAALRTALACLALSPKQQATLEALISAQSRRVQELQAARPAPANKPRGDQSPEAQASRAAVKRTKKQVQAERERVLAMLRAKREAEIQEVHRKSGYNSYLRRLPGSFEGGKK